MQSCQSAILKEAICLCQAVDRKQIYDASSNREYEELSSIIAYTSVAYAEIFQGVGSSSYGWGPPSAEKNLTSRILKNLYSPPVIISPKGWA